MKDEGKTKTQLIDELTKTRKSVTKLAKSETKLKRAEDALEQSEYELKLRNRIAEIFLIVPGDEMYAEVLQVILEGMKSKYGVFGYIDEDGDMIVPTMTGTVSDECQVPNERFVFPWDTWGESTWRKCIREKKTIVLNETSELTPKGHIAITRHTSLPIIHQRESIGLIQVANKDTDYDDADIHLLETIGGAIAPALKARLQRDIREQECKVIQERADHLNLVLRAIRNVNQLITKENDRDRLIKGACENFTETRGYNSAWIALLDESGKLETTAEAGVGKEFQLLNERLRSGASVFCVRNALERSDVLVIEDHPLTCGDCPLAEKSRGRGAMSVRLEHHGKVYGLLTVSTPRNLAADEEEQVLLREVAGDVAFALKAIEKEEEIESTKEFLQNVIDNTSDLVCTVDLEGKILSINRAVIEQMGYEEKEMLGKPKVELAVDPEALEKTFREVLEKDSLSNLELQFKRKDGTIVDILYSAVVSRDKNGHPCAITGFGKDITERKRAEQLAKESEEHLRNLLDGLGPYMFVGVTTVDGTLIEANRPALEAAGLKLEDVLGKPFEDTYWWSYSEPIKQQLRDAIRRAARGETSRYDVVVRSGEDSYIVIDFCLQPLVDEAGKITYLIPSAVVITERKHAEDALRRVNRALKVLSECNHVVVRATDEKSLFREACRTIVEVGGYRLAWIGFAEQDEEKTVRPVAQAGYEEGYFEALNISWADTERGRGPTGTAIRTGKPCVAKNIIHDSDFTPWREAASQRGYASSVAVPLSAGEQDRGSLNVYASEPDAFDSEEVQLLTDLADNLAYGILALRTHAERERMKEALQETHDKLEATVEKRTDELRKKNEELESFTYTVSHDLKAPLRAIQGFSQMLIEDLGGKLESEHREDLMTIGRAAENMSCLIEDLLAYSRLGREAFAKTDVSLERILKYAQAELATDIEQSHADIRVSTPLPVVRGHERTLVRLLTNLLSNAMKFVPPGCRPEIEIMTERAGSRVRVSVRDNGIGINPEFRKKIFGIFERLHSSEEYPGTGIGLAIAQKAVELHAGCIGLESEPGKGSAFWFEIPDQEESL